MNRRAFLQITSVASLPILFGVWNNFNKKKKKYTVKLNSNSKFGHLVRKSVNFPVTSDPNVYDVAVIGGGIAGISALAKLNSNNTILFEADNVLGGTSSFGNYKNVRFPHGAHYDLAYPNYYGKGVLEFLKENEIILPEVNGLHEFVDKDLIIPNENLEQCIENGQSRIDVLGEGEIKSKFEKVLKDFSGKMPLPTRLISDELEFLNKQTFKDFLIQNDINDEVFFGRISYQMKDDWGAGVETISALAGIHYYTCRPYNEKEVELLSSPYGNYYFIEKIINKIDYQKIKINSILSSLKETKNGFDLSVIKDGKELVEVKAKKVIYAAPKFILKYIAPEYYNQFNNISYAPWVVVNIVLQKEKLNIKFWQNDIVGASENFLGFVAAKHDKTDYDVLTCYYCFDKSERKDLLNLESNPEKLAHSTIRLLEKETNLEIEEFVEHVDIKILGHAMPIPEIDYLGLGENINFKDNIAFAGVDTGRLPLFFEACDTGLLAALKINSELKIDV